MTGPRRTRWRPLAIALTAGLALALSAGVPPAQAASGGLDTTFGDGGTATVEIPLPPASGPQFRRGLVVDQAGRILTSLFSSGTSDLASVARLLPDGSPDPAFGTDGYATVDLAVAGLNVVVGDFVVLPDGKVLVYASGIDAENLESALVLMRLMPDGSPDAGFGDGGKLVVRLPVHGYGRAQNLVAAGGHLYVHLTLSNSNGGFTVAKLTPDGAIDTTYALFGFLHLKANNNSTVPASMDLTPDGRILLVGRTSDGDASGWDYALARLLPDGRLDPSFGVGGIVIEDGLGDFTLRDQHAFLPDGSVLISADNGRSLTRFHDNGTIDRSFFDGKLLYTSAVSTLVPAATVSPTGKLVATGFTGNARRIMRVDLATGTDDPTFGTDGSVVIDDAVVLETVVTGGKITTLQFTGTQTYIRRYHNDAPAVAPLRVTAACPPTNPNLGWRVTNPNAQPLRFSWRVVGTGQRGGGLVEAGGQATFSTQRIAGRNKVELVVDGVTVGSAESCQVLPRRRR